MIQAAWIHRQRRFLLALLAILFAAGIIAAARMPVSLFPSVHFPRVVIDVDAGDRPPERMALEVTTPIEEAVRSLPGVASVRSATSRGDCEVSVTFSWDQDMEVALLRAQAAVGQVSAQFPAGTRFTIRRMDPTVFPTLACSVSSSGRSVPELRRLAWLEMRPALLTIDGVASVQVLGGASDELQALVDPDKLLAHRLTIDQVVEAVADANVQAAAGRYEDRGKLVLVVSDTEARSVGDFGSIPIKSGADGIVRLADVAFIRRADEPHWTRVTADGREAVSIQIMQQPGANTVAISREVTRRLSELRARLPKDVSTAIWYDQSQLILASASSVRDALLVGVALASLVLLVALRSWRVTAVALVAVPAVLASTALVMRLLHLDFNIMTLGGMAAAVGLIIDDAIVMVEHVIARSRAQRVADAVGILRLALGFARPLAASSFATIIIFAPLVFLSGVTGAFFIALSLTMAVSLIISFAVALLVVPLLAAALLGRDDIERSEGGFLRDAIADAYRELMRLLLRRPGFVLIGVVALAACGWVCYRALGTGFMPSMDEGGFVIDYRAPPGASLAETDRLVRKVETILGEVPEVATYSRRTGAQLGDGLTEANEGDFFVRLRAAPRRSCDDVMDEVRDRIDRQVPGLHIETAQLMEDLIGDLVANPHPIEVVLSGRDGGNLASAAEAVAKIVAAVPGVVEVSDGIVIAGDTLQVEVDRDRAALEGIDALDVLRQTEAAVSGTVAATVQDGPLLLGLRVWTPQDIRSTAFRLSDLPLHAADGHVFPLGRVARLQTVPGQPQIDHIDLQRVVAVTGRLSGRDLGSALQDIRRALDRPGAIPDGISYRCAGLFEEQQRAFRGLTVVLSSAALLVFLLLIYVYRSFRIAIAMQATTALSLAAVFIGLYLTGTELNISAFMGMTMVVGIVTEVAILFGSAWAEHADAADPRERLIEAGLDRLRPIAMTIVAAALALLPLAAGFGEGADMQRPLAIAIISGLIVQLPLALIALPMLLALLRVDSDRA